MLTVLMERTRPYSRNAGGAAQVPDLNAFRTAKDADSQSDTVWETQMVRTSTA